MKPTLTNYKTDSMSLERDHKRIEYINYLIKQKATGDLDTFARKNGLSKRAMTNFLQQMKALGADIKYDRHRKTYFYGKDGEMTKCMFLEYGQPLTREEAAKVGGPEKLCFSEKAIFVPCKKM